jgi:hypothetical protein
MKRYVINFSERTNGAKEHEWKTVSTEDYDDRAEAMKRFFNAVMLSQHSVDSVSITVTDNVRVQYQMPDEEIATFTNIVD